jgi:hypothetical protein
MCRKKCDSRDHNYGVFQVLLGSFAESVRNTKAPKTAKLAILRAF